MAIKIVDNRSQEEFANAVYYRYLPAVSKLLGYKGDQYAKGNDVALVNFYEGAKLSDDTPSHYLITQATKQWFVISKWSRFGNPLDVINQEVIQRIFDIIVYMLLLIFMIEASGRQKLPGEE